MNDALIAALLLKLVEAYRLLRRTKDIPHKAREHRIARETIDKLESEWDQVCRSS